jgi:hypothetical protein
MENSVALAITTRSLGDRRNVICATQDSPDFPAE